MGLREAYKNLKRRLRLGESKVLMAQVIRETCNEAGIWEQELRNGGVEEKDFTGQVRVMISYYLSHELGILTAEIARHLDISGFILRPLSRPFKTWSLRVKSDSFQLRPFPVPFPRDGIAGRHRTKLKVADNRVVGYLWMNGDLSQCLERRIVRTQAIHQKLEAVHY